ncbi:unnamed protein product [Callosobruchus maculatus]|uniref:Uncharacterized protein n=1 Tax=Callosobruchus maculatus TaxID=64391 RepID=A0A653CA88_CALMS|nr:unnamed protein product [Callosobruchus maculatus]
MNMENIGFLGISHRFPDHIRGNIIILKKHVGKWCAERPMTALLMVIFSTVLVLPFITASVLMPVALLLDFSNYLGSKGWIYVIYMLLFQVVTLGLLLMLLFGIAFIVASSATVLHSYGVTPNLLQKR